MNRLCIRYGHFIQKSRLKDILWLENKRWEIVNLKKRFFEERYGPWFDELFKLKGFKAQTYDSFSLIVVFVTYEEKSFSTDYCWERIKYIKYCDFKELPLLMGQDLNQEEKELLEDRLKGKFPEYVTRQDMYDRYLSNEKRLARLGRIEAFLSELIDEYVRHKYTNMNRYPEKNQLKITINGRDYWYEQNGPIKVIRRPEDNLIEAIEE